jgi:hypothetical protein
MLIALYLSELTKKLDAHSRVRQVGMVTKLLSPMYAPSLASDSRPT